MAADDARLRLCLITDARGDLPRIERVVRAAFGAGCRCVQLREPGWRTDELRAGCERLRPIVDAVGGWLLVNGAAAGADQVVAAGAAHGLQLGSRTRPWSRAREQLGAGVVLGASCHDELELGEAADADCNFALLAPVWPTASKPGSMGLGVVRAAALTANARLPVLWLGGVTAATVASALGAPPHARPAGYAAIGALMGAADPGAAARTLLTAPRASA